MIIEFLEGLQIAGDDMEYIIGISKEPFSFNHLRNSHDRFLEGCDSVSIPFTKGYKNQRRKI